jgi:hypothetical protein
MEQNGGYRNWTMAENQLVHLEADRTQAKLIKSLLYRLFNFKEQNTNRKRPGGYNLRVLPDKTLIKTGNQGDRARHAALRKHQSVVTGLSLIIAEDVKDEKLDAVHMVAGKPHTLRSFIQELKYPLAPKEGEKTTPMFHSVDWATSGPDAGKAILHLTAYKDRAAVAEKVADILPALVRRFISNTAPTEWFTP